MDGMVTDSSHRTSFDSSVQIEDEVRFQQVSLFLPEQSALLRKIIIASPVSNKVDRKSVV